MKNQFLSGKRKIYIRREKDNILTAFLYTFLEKNRQPKVKLKALIFFFLLFTGTSFGQGYFKETPALKEAYHEIVNLKLESARISISKIKENEPNNLLVLHLENYIDFFTVFLNEEKKEFKNLEKNKGKRLKQIQKYGDKTSPYYLFVQAEIELQWALVRAKFDQKFKAARESYNAYVLHTYW